VEVQGFKKAYGLLSYNLVADATDSQFRATIEPLSAGTGSYPEHVKLWLRTPKAGEKPKEVLLNGKPWSAFHNDVIELPGTMMRERLEIVARY
jgi:hypothetical protein